MNLIPLINIVQLATNACLQFKQTNHTCLLDSTNKCSNCIFANDTEDVVQLLKNENIYKTN